MSALGWGVSGQPEPEQKPAPKRTTRKRPTTK